MHLKYILIYTLAIVSQHTDNMLDLYTHHIKQALPTNFTYLKLKNDYL